MPTPKRPQDHQSKTVQNGLTPDVAAWLLSLVNGLTLNVGAPDFDEAMVMVLAARQQLQALTPAD